MYKNATRLQQHGKRVAALFPKTEHPIQGRPKKKAKSNAKASPPFSKAITKRLRGEARKVNPTIKVVFVSPNTWRLQSKDRTLHVKTLKTGLHVLKNWNRNSSIF